jgi:hypothetical protein
MDECPYPNLSRSFDGVKPYPARPLYVYFCPLQLRLATPLSRANGEAKAIPAREPARNAFENAMITVQLGQGTSEGCEE